MVFLIHILSSNICKITADTSSSLLQKFVLILREITNSTWGSGSSKMLVSEENKENLIVKYDLWYNCSHVLSIKVF